MTTLRSSLLRHHFYLLSQRFAFFINPRVTAGCLELVIIPAFSRLTLQPTIQARKIASYGGCGGVHFILMEQD